MTRRCPYCDQALPEIRLGVRLPDLKARIFDLVHRAGRTGITWEDLWALTYSGAVVSGKGIRQARCRTTLKTHISQINEDLEDVGYRIIGHQRTGVYRLEKLNRMNGL